MSEHISVIVPVHNAAPYLQACLDSVLPQLEDADELILIDDASTDDSPAIMAAAAAQDGRIIVLTQRQNQGVSAARNLGLDQARGDFIALLDADDLMAPNRLAVQRTYMESQGLDVCGSHIRMFGESDKTRRFPQNDCHIRMNLVSHGKSLLNPAVMIRRSALGDLRYELGRPYGEDTLFFLDLMRVRTSDGNALRFGNSPEVLTFYRRHASQASQHHNAQKSSVYIDAFYQRLGAQSALITRDNLTLHHDLVRGKARLSWRQAPAYADFLNALAFAVQAEPEDLPDYWREFCRRKLGRSLATLRLRYELRSAFAQQ